MSQEVAQLKKRVAELESALRQTKETAEFWERETELLKKSMLDEKTAQGQLNQARAAALYYGGHHDLCKVPEHASKVYSECDCGFSDFLVGNGINSYVEVALFSALKHLQWGKDVRRLVEISEAMDALKARNAPPEEFQELLKKYGFEAKVG